MSHEDGRTKVDGRPRVLCVDDEPNVLDSLRRQLHEEFTVVGAESGLKALALLAGDASFAVLMSDMRMPTMDGTAVLGEAKRLRPDTVRILLTGQADMEEAVSAVNEGNIFRFLVKPCPRNALIKALTDSVDQHRMIRAEKELLERTLRGGIAALFETLSLANPLAFARATRIQRTVGQMIESTLPENAWCIEVAAMVSQLGTVVLAPETLCKLNSGLSLSPEEELQIRVIPWHAEKLLEQIPRLEVVRQIVHDQATPYERSMAAHENNNACSPPQLGLEAKAAVGAQMLRLAVDLEALEAGGANRAAALTILRRRQGAYDPALLDVLSATVKPQDDGQGGSPVMVDDLRPGMTIVSDLTDGSGRLLVGRGYQVTESLLQRIRNWSAVSGIGEPIYIVSEQTSE
jgi:CheY-like chemotaxis protein